MYGLICQFLNQKESILIVDVLLRLIINKLL
ncbi:MAG: hypothetical protein ACI8VT_002991, partial [Saprospiraceae bacterium]